MNHTLASCGHYVLAIGSPGSEAREKCERRPCDRCQHREPMIYLASPYSHPDESIRIERFHAACDAAASLMRLGYVVFSPIAHTHPIAVRNALPLGWEFWETFDRTFVEKCDELYVLQIEGWDTSKGVTAEIEIARSLGKPVRHWHP